MCAQQRFRSACVFAQCDQNHHWMPFWLVKDAEFLHEDNKDADQTARMRRLIRVLVWRTSQKVRFLTLRLTSSVINDLQSL